MSDFQVGLIALSITWLILGSMGMIVHANRYKAPSNSKIMYRIY